MMNFSTMGFLSFNISDKSIRTIHFFSFSLSAKQRVCIYLLNFIIISFYIIFRIIHVSTFQFYKLKFVENSKNSNFIIAQKSQNRNL